MTQTRTASTIKPLRPDRSRSRKGLPHRLLPAHRHAAAAVCRACGKGVCRRCAIEVPFGVACSTACEPFARALVELQQQSMKGIGNIRATRFIQPAMAVLFIAYGASMLGDDDLRPMAIFAVSAGVAVLGAWVWGQRKDRDRS